LVLAGTGCGRERQHRGRLRRLFDMLPIQAGFLNAAMVLEFTNLQSLRDFNMTFEQLEQWTTSRIIHVDDHEKNRREVTRLLTTGEMMDQESSTASVYDLWPAFQA
jgi:hypothetical protein